MNLELNIRNYQSIGANMATLDYVKQRLDAGDKLVLATEYAPYGSEYVCNCNKGVICRVKGEAKVDIMNTRYRLYVEDVKPEYVSNLISGNFSGFTVFSGVGYWKRDKENCACYEIIANDGDRGLITKIASLIRWHCNQDAVLLTVEPIETTLITD